MKNIFIEYPKCSTCKKAKKWLEENNIEFTSRNIVTQAPTAQELNEWIKNSGQDIKKWFNTSGLKYKELNLKEKLSTMSNEEKIQLLASDGMLIKRPLLISDKGILIGFKEEMWKKISRKICIKGIMSLLIEAIRSRIMIKMVIEQSIIEEHFVGKLPKNIFK